MTVSLRKKPLFVTNAIEDKNLPLFTSSKNKREWIHVDDHARGLTRFYKMVLERRIISALAWKNIEEMTDIILKHWQTAITETYVPDRLGHDRRYLLIVLKLTLARLGAKIKFEDGLRQTIEWYKNNEDCGNGEDRGLSEILRRLL